MFGLIPFNTNNSQNKGSVDNFFDDFFNDSFLAPINVQKSKFNTDVIEKDNEYEVKAELPGIKKEDIKLDYKNDHLVVSAKREDEHDEKKDRYVRRECSYGEVSRSFYFDDVDEDKISAKFKNGILKVTLPKKVKKEDKATSISIE